jgi:hypothetical protein
MKYLFSLKFKTIKNKVLSWFFDGFLIAIDKEKHNFRSRIVAWWIRGRE